MLMALPPADTFRLIWTMCRFSAAAAEPLWHDALRGTPLLVRAPSLHGTACWVPLTRLYMFKVLYVICVVLSCITPIGLDCW